MYFSGFTEALNPASLTCGSTAILSAVAFNSELLISLAKSSFAAITRRA